jgi:hypothetical protein
MQLNLRNIQFAIGILLVLSGNNCFAQPKTTYFENGECCITDSLNGPIHCYNSKGKLTLSGKFKNRQRDSTWTYYDSRQNGIKYAITEYEKGAIAKTIVWSFYGNREIYSESTIIRDFHSPCNEIIMHRTLYYYETAGLSANIIYETGYIVDGNYWDENGQPISKPAWQDKFMPEKGY